MVCQLGNPYTPPPHTVDRLVFRVLPRTSSSSSSSVIQRAVFTASANTSSEDVGDSTRPAPLEVLVVKRHEVSVRSLVQPDRIWYGGVVRGESAMKVRIASKNFVGSADVRSVPN